MYTTCTYCYGRLGTNDLLHTMAVGRRIAFDPAKGCLWVVCPACTRWNLAPLEDRWDAVEECEREFRATTLRYSSGSIGLAWLGGDVDLIRVGPALRPELAAWRYGRVLAARGPVSGRAIGGVARLAALAVRRVVTATSGTRHPARAAMAELLLGVAGGRVVDLLHLARGEREGADLPVGVVRLRHLARASLVRPEPGRPWALRIPHDTGEVRLEGEAGVRAAARMLAVVNGTERGAGFSRELLSAAVARVDESARPDSYFNRVLAIALRTSWGRAGASDEGRVTVESLEVVASETERLAWRLTGRTFWGRGGIGSEPSTSLLDIPLVDRVALEIAAHEETERRALDGELALLADAWREADEIATIADALFD